MATEQIPTTLIADDAVTGDKIENNPTVAGNLTVSGTSTLTGNSTVGGTLGVTGISTLTGNVTAGGNLTVTGNLTVSGTQTTINTATLDVEDKNIEIAKVSSPSDTTATGAGITVKGGTIQSTYHNSNDKLFQWQGGSSSQLAFSSSHKIVENKGSSAFQRPLTTMLALG